jgi:hypothetical protein
MKTVIAIALLCALCACSTVLADNPKIISLTSSEKAKAMAMLEHRQQIFQKRAKLDAQYAAEVHRLDEEMGSVNIEANDLCFQLKKSHAIAPNVNYSLDEVNARLVKQ